MAAFGTKFIEYNEELLPKLIPAVIDEYWYPKDEEGNNQDDETPGEVVDGQ
jgi:hypothetical protein